MKLTSRSGRHAAKIELQMTSMIDCVFLLLIFFMVTASFQKTEREIDAATKAERVSGQAAADLAPAIVEVVRSGSGYVYRVGGRETASRTELTELLAQFDNKTQGAFVRAEDDAPYILAVGALQACTDAGFALRTYQPLAVGN
jgi:biopolymer transport protein ExbD